ncbi:MAG: hypothetical protein QM817_04330 [Archangium sp.]
MTLALVLGLTLSQTPLTPVDAMRGDMKTYFAGETSEGWAFGGLGLVSVGSATGLLLSNTNLGRGMSVPLFAVGVIQLALAIGLFVRTPGQVAGFDAQLTNAPAEYKTGETTRMERVMRGFAIYKAAEVGLFFGGVALSGAGGISKSDFALGAGITLAAEALVMLILDFYAEGRGRVYQAAISGFTF